MRNLELIAQSDKLSSEYERKRDREIQDLGKKNITDHHNDTMKGMEEQQNEQKNDGEE